MATFADAKQDHVTLQHGTLKTVAGGVTAPAGFRAAGVHAGIKRKRKDVAVIVSDVAAAAAAVFTTNKVQAAPVQVTREHVAGGRLRAVVANSGNANAVTGPEGLADARRMAALVAEALGAAPQEVAVASTGVIGVRLPMDKVEAGIAKALAALGRSEDAAAADAAGSGDGNAGSGHAGGSNGDATANGDGHGNGDGPDTGSLAAARAIMTTDTVPKEIAVEFMLKGRTVRLGGIAKGSGMIHPNMATMLAFLTTDAAVAPAALQQALRRSAQRTYNRITVDGDTSTNDMVVIMANGLAGHDPVEADDPALAVFQEALDYVNTHLAKAIARDGEGATKLIEVRVEGAPDEAAALQAARAVAGSSLVKTAVYGNDANWGRILAAVGYSGIDFDPATVDIWIGDVAVARRGAGVAFDEAAASAALRRPEVLLRVALNAGDAAATVWTCDLTEGYININASYRS